MRTLTVLLPALRATRVVDPPPSKLTTSWLAPRLVMMSAIVFRVAPTLDPLRPSTAARYSFEPSALEPTAVRGARVEVSSLSDSR